VLVAQRYEKVVFLWSGVQKFHPKTQNVSLAVRAAVAARRLNKPGFGIEILKRIKDQNRNWVVWNTMAACAKSMKRGDEAFDVYTRMKKNKVPLTIPVMHHSMVTCAMSKMWKEVDQVYEDFKRTGVRPHQNQFKALVNAAIGQGRTERRFITILQDMKNHKMQMPELVGEAVRGSEFAHVLDMYKDMQPKPIHVSVSLKDTPKPKPQAQAKAKAKSSK
jgi:pentatricopeptide repeat protein